MTIEESKMVLIDTLRSSEEYERYLSSRELLIKNADVLDQIMEIRRETMELYSTECEDLLERSESLARRMDDLNQIPGVTQFLSAEEELFHILRKIDRDVISSLLLTSPKMADQNA